MIVLVDGYNVMKMVFSCRGQQFRMEKKNFICSIGKYFKIKSKTIRQILLFFDGGSSMQMTREIKNGVVVMQSGQRMSADDIILEYIEKKNSQEILLVTNDRELIKLSHQNNKYVVCMDSDAFWELVCKTIIMDKGIPQSNKGAGGGMKKINHDDNNRSSNSEFDALMAMASMHLPDKDHDELKNENDMHKRKKRGTLASVIKKI